jgi:hypothetical protein
MLSPVLKRAVCCGFKESETRLVELEDVEPACFQHVLDLWCGRDSVEIESMQQLMQTAGLADRFEVAEGVVLAAWGGGGGAAVG